MPRNRSREKKNTADGELANAKKKWTNTCSPVFFLADCARGDEDRALLPNSCFIFRNGELAPILEPISGEVEILVQSCLFFLQELL